MTVEGLGVTAHGDPLVADVGFRIGPASGSG